MVILGIDYGEKNIGLALATGPLAEPLVNLKVNPRLSERLRQICLNLKVEKIVIGISERKIASQTKSFATKLKKELKLPILFQDETLTTKQAQQKLFEAKKKSSKRKGPDHAFAASLILQDYLDFQESEANQNF